MTVTKFLVGGVICLIIAAACLYLFYINWRRDKLMQAWPVAPGVISSISIDRVSLASPGSDSRAYRPHWVMRASYSYVVNNIKYTGNNVFSNVWEEPIGYNTDDPQPPAGMTAINDKFKSGEQVQVHYDPVRPEKSYLQFRANEVALYLVAGLGAFFLIIGILLFFV